ncbi:MAG: DUF992 domain-containing protein [Gammaproteobacteria bacterium]|nr:DUF992 domain-containing protein [Gammaproteobacteria bacterium]
MKLANKVTLAAAVALLAAAGQGVMAQEGVKLGVIECSVVPGSRVNLLIRSTADVTCTFNNQGTMEKYKGETGIALGLDLSFKQNEKISFAVIGAVDDVKPGAHALRGKFVGGEASAAAGVGVGAKALVGGSNKNVALQPLAVETSTGLGVSGGLAFLYLEPAE